jgi:hypothetical protein
MMMARPEKFLLKFRYLAVKVRRKPRRGFELRPVSAHCPARSHLLVCQLAHPIPLA